MALEIAELPVEVTVDEGPEDVHPAIPVARAIAATAANEARAVLIDLRPIGAP
jgi:hypothetical protein